MKLIIGLGNPGRSYKDNRHNVGSLLIDRLAKREGIQIKRMASVSSYLGKVRFKNKIVILARPVSYMNLSGRAVRLLMKRYKIEPKDLLVLIDDLNLELGKIRIKPKGSSGGHKGIESIIDMLGSCNFARLRVGIDRPRHKKAVSDYVLGNWTQKQKKELSGYLDRAVDCCRTWIISGTEKAMNEFN